MCLPNSWVGGSAETLAAVQNELQQMGPAGLQMAAAVQQANNTFYALDTDALDSSAVTNVNIIKDSGNSTNLPVSQYIQQTVKNACKQIPDAFAGVGGKASCLEQGEVTVGSYKAGRVVLDETLQGNHMKAVAYSVVQGTTDWTVTFTADASEFATAQSIFEKAISTLQIN
jgi:hypothetical protein